MTRTRLHARPAGATARAPHRLAASVLALALAAAAGACAARRSAGVASPPALALATFDSAWAVIHRTHFDTTFNGVDWVALRTELRPRAQAARTRGELRAVIQDMLGRLRQSHFALIPAERADEQDGGGADAAEPGDVGLEVRVVGDDVVVFRLDEQGPAARAGVRPGWVVRRIGDLDLAQLVREMREREREGAAGFYSVEFQVVNRFNARALGAPGTPCRIAFLDGEGRPVEHTLVRRPWPGAAVKLGNLPVMLGRVWAAPAHDADVRAGVIRFSVWLSPLAAEIDDAVDRFRAADGIVLDLRGNPGGLAAMVGGVAGHFLDERALLGVQQSRGAELRFTANPRLVNRRGERVQPFAGPVAILVDRLSASASEIFAGGMQSIGRARIFGETTAGGALPATTHELPNGDVLMHAVGDFLTARGERLEGRGVIPDEAVSLTRADLLAGRDAALLAALRWIGAQRAANPDANPR